MRIKYVRTCSPIRHTRKATRWKRAIRDPTVEKGFKDNLKTICWKESEVIVRTITFSNHKQVERCPVYPPNRWQITRNLTIYNLGRNVSTSVCQASCSQTQIYFPNRKPLAPNGGISASPSCNAFMWESNGSKLFPGALKTEKKLQGCWWGRIISWELQPCWCCFFFDLWRGAVEISPEAVPAISSTFYVSNNMDLQGSKAKR